MIINFDRKIVVINSLVQTLFVHKLLALPTPPDTFFQRYRQLIQNFLWKGKIPKIGYNKLVQNYDQLGLKLIDLELKNYTLKAACPIRWLGRENNCNDLDWVYNRCPIKDQRIWDCNLAPEDIKKNMPTESNQFSLLRLILFLSNLIWGNSHIRRNNSPIFDHMLINSNINCIMDIFDPICKSFVTYEQLVGQFGEVMDYLTYLGIIAAIPNIWKISLKNFDFDEPLDVPNTLHFLSEKGSAAKRIYWSLLENKFPPSLGTKLSIEATLDTNLSIHEWWALYPNFMAIVKPSKLRYFQYCILTCSLTTNVRRSKWSGGKISDLCTFCKRAKETVVHVLFECEYCIKLWDNLKRILKYFFNVELTLSKQLIILNNYNGPNKQIVNLLISILKQHIYSEKCFDRIPTFEAYMTKLSWWYLIEKQIVSDNYK